MRVAAAFGTMLLLLGTALSADNSAEAVKLLRSARYQIKLKKFETAQGLLQQVLSRDPKSAEAHNLVGVCQMRMGRFEDARRSFEQAIQLDSKFAFAYLNLGNVLLGSRNENDAMKNFRAALAIDPKILTRDPTSYTAFNVWGLCLIEERRYAEASRAFERSIRINPKFAPAHVNLGNALVGLKKQDAALKEFTAALALQPKDFLALYNVGLICARQGKLGSAAKYLRNAHETSPGDKSTVIALIGAELSLGRAAEAEALLAQLGGVEALDPATREQLVTIWFENDPARAAEFAGKDQVLAHGLYQSGYRKAEGDFENGHYDEAAKILEAIRGLQPPKADFHDLLGSIYYALDAPKKASDEFQAAVKMEPADPDHYYKLGMIFLKHSTPEPAIYVFETATKIRPDVPRLWLGLG